MGGVSKRLFENRRDEQNNSCACRRCTLGVLLLVKENPHRSKPGWAESSTQYSDGCSATGLLC